MSLTSRERLLAVLNRLPTDRLAWTTLVDDVTRSALPPDLRTCPTLDFYKRIGCDFASMGNYGLTSDESVASPCRLVMPEVEARSVHPTRYPLQTPDDVAVLTQMWLGSRYEECGETESTYQRFEEAAGDDALYIAAVEGSPVQQLIEYEAGVEGFYYLLNEAPEQIHRLLDAMHRRRCEEIELQARRMPSEGIILVENTSSTLISPKLYRELSLPQLKDYVDILHRHGKKAILHMCGLLRNLLDGIAETGLDAIHGLTPPAFGDTEYEEALDRYGEGFVIWGGIFPGEVLHRPDVTYEQVSATLDSIYTPRMRNANFLLWVAVDGIPTPLDRFQMIGDWMGKHGAR